MSSLIELNTERAYLYAPDINVCMMAVIASAPSEIDLNCAVSLITTRHPLLTSTILIDDKNRAYYRLNSAAPVTVDYNIGGSAYDWQHWFNFQNEVMFDFEHGPLLRIYAQVCGNSTTLVLYGHHLLGDGLAYFYLMRDLLSALGGKLSQEIERSAIIRDSGDLPPKGRLKLLSRLALGALNRQYKKGGRRYSFDDYEKLYRYTRTVRQPGMSRFSLDREETGRLIETCREHGVTVNEAITTAFMYARLKAGSDSDYVGISCSVREQLTVNPQESLGNYVSGVAFSAVYDTAQDFWSNARRVQAQSSAMLKDCYYRFQALSALNCLDNDSIDSIIFAGIEQHPHRVTVILREKLGGTPYDRGLGISNLGRQNPGNSAVPVTDFLFIPPLFRQNDFIVGVVTVDGRMSFCLRYIGAEYSAEDIESQFDDAKSVLLDVRPEKRIKETNL